MYILYIETIVNYEAVMPTILTHDDEKVSLGSINDVISYIYCYYSIFRLTYQQETIHTT